MKKLLLLSAVIASVTFGAVTITKVKETELLKDTEVVTDISGVASKEDVTSVENRVKQVEGIVIGEDCQLVSTNYNSTTKLPSLLLRFRIKDEGTGETVWYKVWEEMTRWNWFLYGYLPTNYYNKVQMDAALDNKADRAWGHYDSHTGSYAPDGFTWISSPKIAIAGGMAYQRILTTEGAVWVLESNGMTTFTGGETNGYFRISDDKGNSLFEISKGTERVVGATASRSYAKNLEDGTTLITVHYFAGVRPTIEVCRDLKTQDWKVEGDDDFPATVSAMQMDTGGYFFEITTKAKEPRLFVKATYKVTGKDMIKNIAPVSFTEIVIDGVTYKVKVETISDKKVLVLE